MIPLFLFSFFLRIAKAQSVDLALPHDQFLGHLILHRQPARAGEAASAASLGARGPGHGGRGVGPAAGDEEGQLLGGEPHRATASLWPLLGENQAAPGTRRCRRRSGNRARDDRREARFGAFGLAGRLFSGPISVLAEPTAI
jgi:hypothetical protein